eukprot:6187271-Pleurochrysis_carterae.AAC.1
MRFVPELNYLGDSYEMRTESIAFASASARARALTSTQAQAHAHARTHARTHTHARTCAHSNPRSFWYMGDLPTPQPSLPL